MEKRIIYLIEDSYDRLCGVWDDIEELAAWVSAKGIENTRHGSAYETGLDEFMDMHTPSSYEIGTGSEGTELDWSYFFPTE